MSILSRYTLKRFIFHFLWSSASFLIVFILVDLVENFDRYIDKQAAFFDVLMMYAYFIPWVFVIVSPIGLLLAANFTGISMARHNEVTAAKSAGISAFKLGIPIYTFGFLWSIVILIFAEFVVPPAVSLQKEIKEVKVLKRRLPVRVIDNLFFSGTENETYSFKSYSVKTRIANEVNIVYYDENQRITKRIDAPKLKWEKGKFVLEDAYIRYFNAEKESVDFFPIFELKTDEKPENYEKLRIDPNEMGFFDLKNFIKKSEQSGRNPSREKTDLIIKVTFPFSNLIILLFSLPIAFKLRRSGTALGFGASFLIAFIYFSLVNIGQSLGYNESLSPFVAASLGNLVFGILGIFTLYRLRD